MTSKTKGDVSSFKLRVISLGAGVQSSTMALMAAAGEFETMPDCAIFAGTGWEPKPVYDWLAWLEAQLPFPVHRVSNGNIRDDLTRAEKGRYASVPFFLKMPVRTEQITMPNDFGNEYQIEYERPEQKGLGRRQCTNEYKLKPMMWKSRELLNVGRRDRIEPGTMECWIGISIDEASRMKGSRINGRSIAGRSSKSAWGGTPASLGWKSTILAVYHRAPPASAAPFTTIASGEG